MPLPRRSRVVSFLFIAILAYIGVLVKRKFMSPPRVIVVGGGLAGLSAAHTVLQNGASVLLLDKMKSLGGNSVKASSGINGAGTPAQAAKSIVDSVDDFIKDTTASAGSLARPNLISALASNSASSLEWLGQLGIDLSQVTRLGGHTIPRTHRGNGGPPGWAITSALFKKLDTEEKATVVKSATVTKLLEADGKVVGVEYAVDGSVQRAEGPVILATGGYAADFSSSGFLSQYRPELLSVPTTNGGHATGDGLKLSVALSTPAALVDMDQIQVHPTGFVDPSDTSSQTKFLAAEALRGVGGILLNGTGERFVNEVERRDFVTARMQEVIAAGHGPVRLVLNKDAADELAAHIGFYVSKGLMQRVEGIKELASVTGLDESTLSKTFEAHLRYANKEEADPFGKVYFSNPKFDSNGQFLVATMTPVVHYTMGGLSVDELARVLHADGTPISGLYAGGEVIGGVHGQNRLGGSSLLEAVVFGRLAGHAAVEGK
ncbi:fumarate reductase flavo protein subunit [Cylindrobasidium torrendii FP15055 ss-10]|uniref:Fumarate reductase n=1 Tax=Cylindrobasidium torrendii FP15055 ss-10 TaxID=1314674 RepID=A0A0D7BV65_9AGAR|nr:fumarate reductase flavo protein subunit [Cylindrobasidium torrendii FP15055 ss-10]